MNTNDKLDLLRYLIFIRGKLQHLSIELLTMGQDTAQVDAAEKKLATDINLLRSKVMDDWSGNADNIMQQLRDLNEEAQGKIRELRSATDKAQKVTEFVAILDKGLGLLSGLLA
ncbi:MAG: hypothetical protein Tsb002_11710 [Wenzhouxiangellaceae bacterium]